MIQTTPLSQRDTRWKDKKLGFGTGTIGSYGCTLTCVTAGVNSFGANLDVDEANEKLKAVGGFGGDTKNLIIWSALPKAFPQIVSNGIPEAYNNDKAKDMIAKGYPVIVKVNGSSIGASSHWCLLLGDQQMLDPWTGKVVSTSTYPILSLVVWTLKRVDDPCADTRRKLEESVREVFRLTEALKKKEEEYKAFQSEMEQKLSEKERECQAKIQTLKGEHRQELSQTRKATLNEIIIYLQNLAA